MKQKTYRVKLSIGDKRYIYRTDGVPTYCCSLEPSYFVKERDTKYNDYNGWYGYVGKNTIQESLGDYNPDNLIIE